MRREELETLMHRAIDGVLTEDERRRLARVFEANPLLKNEFEELQATHVATESLFRQIALPTDFSRRVMGRIQERTVPADTADTRKADSFRLPKGRRGARRAVILQAYRRKTRYYGVFAACSAAAALFLAVGIVTGVFTRTPNLDSGTRSPLAEGSRSGSGVEGLHRTNPSPVLPEEREAPRPDKAEGASQPSTVVEGLPPKSSGDKDDPDSTVIEEDQKKPAIEDPPVRPDPSGGDSDAVIERPIEKPDTPDVTETPPKDEVVEAPVPPKNERPTDPDRQTVTEVKELGSLTVLSGWAELQSGDGVWVRANPDDAPVMVGFSVRTSRGGAVMVSLKQGDIVLAGNSEVGFDKEGGASLREGDAMLRRPDTEDGEILSIRCDGYEARLGRGSLLLTRRGQGVTARSLAADVELRHADQGNLVLAGGNEVDVDFRRGYSETRESSGLLPHWAAQARANRVLTFVEPALKVREFSARERQYFDRNMPRRLEALLRHPVDDRAVVALASSAVMKDSMDARAACAIVSEVESALTDYATLDSEYILGMGRYLTNDTRNFQHWRETFHLILSTAAKYPDRRPVIPSGSDK